jgi:hypothetical protein
VFLGREQARRLNIVSVAILPKKSRRQFGENVCDPLLWAG